jgi:hypothetical protein
VRVVLLVAAAGIPALLLVLVMAILELRHVTEDVAVQSRQLVQVQVARQQQMFESARHVLEVLALTPQVRGNSAEDCSMLLATMRGREPPVANGRFSRISG